MKTLTLLAVLFLHAAPARADILFLNKGDEINGSITALDSDSVRISVAGKEQTYARKDVMKLQLVKEYSSGAPDPFKDPETAALLAAPPSPDAYPNDGFISWLEETDITVNPDRSWSVTRRGLRYVLRERGKSPSAYLDHNFLPGLEDTRIDYAYSITDSTVSYLTDISVMDGSPNVEYPTYDRLRLLKYAIPNVQIGSVLGYKSHTDTVYASTYPFFADYGFRAYEPVKTYRLVVTVPEQLKLSYYEFNLPKGVVFSKTDKDGISLYTWEAGDLPSYREEDDSPPFFRYTPQVLLSLDNGSWDDLRAQLAPLLKERLVITPDMKAKAEQLTAGKKSDTEKAEALFNWTAREIKYQPVSPDDYSYLPRPSGEIFDSKAGNALDKPFLLYAMLQAAGFSPEFAYVHSKEAPFADKLVNIRQFDYAECLLQADGKELTLAPLGDTRRYTELPSRLQGMPAFKVLGEGSARFTNPDHTSDQETDRTEASYTLSPDGALAGSYTEKMSGGYQAAMREYKDYKKDDLDRAMEKLAHSIHPEARLKSYKLENLEDLSKDLVFSLSLEAPGYAMKAGKYMILKVPGLDYSAADAAETERELPLFWYSRGLTSQEVTLKLPPGYRLYYAPKDLDLKLAGESYKASFRASPGTLKFNEEYRLDNTWITPEAYPDYKAFKQALAQFSESWIVLKKD
jgi:transglutaminase-like putative cysteine protease